MPRTGLLTAQGIAWVAVDAPFMCPVARSPSAAASAPRALATAALGPRPVLDRFFETPPAALQKPHRQAVSGQNQIRTSQIGPHLGPEDLLGKCSSRPGRLRRGTPSGIDLSHWQANQAATRTRQRWQWKD
jgi:hypothetical protein